MVLNLGRASTQKSRLKSDSSAEKRRDPPTTKAEPPGPRRGPLGTTCGYLEVARATERLPRLRPHATNFRPTPMTRSPRSPGLIGPLRKRPAPSRILARPRALVALLITLLQVLGALHFALVPHSFSAALGGVVHVHGESALLGAPRAFARESANLALVAADAACIADLCPFA